MPIDVPGQPLSPFVHRSYGGGINTRLFPLDIGDDEAVRLENIDTTTVGQRVKRQGSSLAATGITHGPILAMASYRPKSLSTNTSLLAVSAGASAGDHKQLWEWDGTTTEFSHVSALTGFTADPFSDDGQCEIIVGLDLNQTEAYVALINTTQVVDKYTYDGLTVAAAPFGGTNPPRTAPFANHLNRGFGIGINAQRNRVYFSDVGAFTTTFVGAGNSISFGGNGMQAVVAMESFRQRELIVLMEDRLEVLDVTEAHLGDGGGTSPSGDPFTSWSRRVIDASIGCGSKESVAASGKDVLFADQYGNIRSVARTIQDVAQGRESLPISEPIDSWIKRINPSFFRSIVGATFDRWYLLGLPIDNAETADHLFLLDIARTSQRGAPVWDGPWTGLDINRMVEATLTGASDSADQNPTLYFGGAATSAGLVWKLFRGSDDAGTDIVYQEEGKRLSLGSLDIKKHGRTLDVYAVASANVTLCIEGNPDAAGYQTIGYMNLLGSVPELPEELPFTLGGEGIVHKAFDVQDLGYWRDLQIRMTATTDQDVKILGYSLKVQPQNYEWGRNDG